MTEHRNLPASVESQNGTYVPSPPAYAGILDEDEKKGGPGLKRLLQAVLRYKWVVLPLVVVGTASAVFASRYVRLKYVANASVWIERGGNLSSSGPIQSTQLLQNDAWVDLMKSYVVLDHVVREHRLYLTHAANDTAIMASFRLDSMFTPGNYRLVVDASGLSIELRTKEGLRIETVRAGEPIGRQLGFNWQPPKRELEPKRQVAFSVITPRDAALQLNREVDSRIMKNGNFMRVSYSGDNPRLVAGVVNSTVKRFIEVAERMKTEKLEELSNILQHQLDYAYTNLREAEFALENFQVQTITLPTEPYTPVPASDATRTSVVSAFFGTKIQLDALQRDRESVERALAISKDSVSLDALSIVPAVQQSPELSTALGDLAQKRAGLRVMRQQYTDQHPLVSRALADIDDIEHSVIPRLGQNLITELKAREAGLSTDVATSSTELKSIPPRVIEESRLRRTVASADRLYTDLLQRVENARLATATTVPDVRILDDAVVPRRPALDQRMRLVLLGFLGSLGLGIGLAILLDRVDPRLRYAEQVTEELGLPIVGAVPSLGRPRMKLLGSPNGGPQVQVVEALRSIRLGLMHAYGSAGPMMITISSPGSGDGKTFVTSNLGLTFADLGLKTLLIDGDTRRGALHRMFGIERKPGLTDYLNGTADADDVIYKTRFPLVDVMPSGSRRGNAPELLSSAAMGEMLARIRAEYQVILIDSPPLGAGVDPLVLASLAGNMLLVLRTGITDRTLAEAKLKMLDRLPIRLVGTVLNGFDAADAFRYYSYMPGYEAGAEETGSADVLQPA